MDTAELSKHFSRQDARLHRELARMLGSIPPTIVIWYRDKRVYIW